MLKEIITKWLGEEKNKCNHNISQEDGYCHLCFSIKLNESHFDNGYNQALQDLKSRIPELEEMILGVIEKRVIEIIVKNYEDASRRYKRVKEKKEHWAKSDAISENSKMVAYSRLEPEIRKAIKNTLKGVK